MILNNCHSNNEIWKDIEGYQGYQVSNLGNVRTYNKITYTEKHGKRKWKNRNLKFKPSLSSKGAGQGAGYRVSLWKNGKEKDFLVARLVLANFTNTNINTKLTVNHKDGNRLNNNIENLEWLTLSENIKYGFTHGQYNKVQKECILQCEDEEYKFRSYSEASRFLDRTHNYIGEKIKNGKLKCESKDGKEYILKSW